MSDRIEDLEALLADTDQAYRVAVSVPQPSPNGVAALLRVRRDLTVQIHDERERLAALSRETAPQTEEEVIALAVQQLSALPTALLDRILHELAESGCADSLRRAAPRLTLVQ